MNGWGRMVQGVLDLFAREDRPPPESSVPEPPAKTQTAGQGQVVREVASRKKRGWSLVRRNGGWVCLVPPSLYHAPLDIQEQLDQWIRAALHPSPGSRLRKQQSQRAIFAWMEPRLEEKVPEERAAGIAWDLRPLFDQLNQEYFQGRLEAVVRWSPKWGGLSTHQSLKISQGIVHLITIARAYDAADVPRYAVEGVLFHEMCHIAHPPRRGGGHKRVIHHKEFREAEQRYAQWGRWREWERRHLRRKVKRGHILMTGHV
ncbi:MAG TPA: SprT-like domain-containing protein [Fibrobacteria bacterium]|nr:SprT-like domain-containing protein [Fibrobacteria bacterium]